LIYFDFIGNNYIYDPSSVEASPIHNYNADYDINNNTDQLQQQLRSNQIFLAGTLITFLPAAAAADPVT
jgi:hypothetical protein